MIGLRMFVGRERCFTCRGGLPIMRVCSLLVMRFRGGGACRRCGRCWGLGCLHRLRWLCIRRAVIGASWRWQVWSSPDHGLRGTQYASERLRSATPEGTTASIGLAERRAGESTTELIARADTALYKAKSEGRDRLQAA